MSDERTLPRRGWLALGAVLSLLFVVYGSLVPFERSGVGIDVARTTFAVILEAGVLVGSRVDFGSNVLLMVPGGFFLAGALWCRGRVGLNLLTAVLCFCVCAGVAAAVEFLQLFFSSRSTALSDIVAQGIGAVTGIAAWWLAGARLWPRYFRDNVAGAPDGAMRILIIYAVAMLLYQLTPLDITLHPGDLVEKWQRGRIAFWPQLPAGSGIAVALYEVFSDFVAWIPLGYLAWRIGRYPMMTVVAGALIVIGSVEALQLLVYSRHSAVSDIIIGTAGAACGRFIAARWSRERAVTSSPAAPGLRHAPVLTGLAFALLWFGGLCLVFWYPFDFEVNRRFFQAKSSQFFSLPLESYYRSSILGATSGVFRKAALFLPFGIALAYAVRTVSGRAALVAKALAVTAVAGAAMTVELGQLFLVSKVARFTDVVFMFAGALGGYVIAARMMRAGPARGAP